MMGLTPPIEGGSQRHIYEISENLNNNVLTQRGSLCRNKISLPIIQKNNFLINVTFFIFCLIYTIKLLLIKKHKIIHIHENLLYLLAPILKLRYKVIITVHGITGFKFYDKNYLWFLFKLGLKTADLIISVSVTDKDKLKKEFDNVVYIPNGVDTSLYETINPKIDKKITFIGRIHKQKGVYYLLKAYQKLDTNFKLNLLAKENDYAEKLKKQFKNKNIKWRGFILDREKLFSEIASSYVLVYPSIWEALPWPALLEGLASGRPVIASNLEGMNQIFKNNKNIILVNPEDSEKLAEKISYLINNLKQAEEIGKKGKKLAEKFDWKIIAKKTKTQYNKLLSNKK